MNHATISRRQFAHLLGAGAAAALVRPKLSFGRENPSTVVKTSVVRLSANENPYGPSVRALKAMTDTFSIACRYPDEHADALVEGLARLNNVSNDQILLGDGSSEILKLCAEAFTGPQLGPLVA